MEFLNNSLFRSTKISYITHFHNMNSLFSVVYRISMYTLYQVTNKNFSIILTLCSLYGISMYTMYQVTNKNFSINPTNIKKNFLSGFRQTRFFTVFVFLQITCYLVTVNQKHSLPTVKALSY